MNTCKKTSENGDNRFVINTYALIWQPHGTDPDLEDDESECECHVPYQCTCNTWDNLYAGVHGHSTGFGRARGQRTGRRGQGVGLTG